MRYTFTAIYVDGEDGWIVGYLEELPGVVGQGRTIEETERSLREAAELVLRFNRERTAEAFQGRRVAKREMITVRDYAHIFRRGRGEA
jgi:predicted RNase H-like HicB family nuclease